MIKGEEEDALRMMNPGRRRRRKVPFDAIKNEDHSFLVLRKKARANASPKKRMFGTRKTPKMMNK